MKNTKQKKIVINGDISTFLRGLIIGKVLTLLVIGGLFWWLLKTRLSFQSSAESSSNQNSNTTYVAASTFQTVSDVPINSFNYGGTTAWLPIRQVVDFQIQSARPELQLHYLKPTNGSPSSSSGIRMLLDGQLDFAVSSRPLTDEEYATAKQRGFSVEQRQVAIDPVAVILNPSLKIPGLTIDQLQQIYQGQITNWKVLGGPDLPITPFSQPPQDADMVIFSANRGLKKPGFSSNVQYVPSSTEGIHQVNQTPGSLYYASARTVVPQCSVKLLPLGRTSTSLIPPYRQPLIAPEQCPRQRNQVNTEAIKNGNYPITANLFVIIKQNKDREQQVGEAYARLLLTEQGQKAIEQVGFQGVR